MSSPECRTANELPDLRLHLRDQWAPGRPFARVAHTTPMGIAEPDRPYDPDAYCRWEHRVLSDATLWWVAEDMVDLLLAAAPTTPDDALGEELQVPAPSGLVVFAKPWFGLDSNGSGMAVQVNALAWGTARWPGREPEADRLVWALSTYTRVGLTPKYDSGPGDFGIHEDSRWPDSAPRISAPEPSDDTVVVPRGMPDDFLARGEDAIREWGGVAVPAPNTPGGVHAHGTIWVPLGRSDWPKRQRLTDPPVASMDDAAVASAVEDRRVFAAFCALIAQEGITRTETRPAQRQAAKRTERAGLPREASSLRIITLRPVHRTESAPDADGHGVAYSHRWIVNGHWRWQPHGPGRSLRRLQYIRPFVKGPEGAELKIKQEVRAWVR